MYKLLNVNIQVYYDYMWNPLKQITKKNKNKKKQYSTHRTSSFIVICENTLNKFGCLTPVQSQLFLAFFIAFLLHSSVYNQLI